MFWKHHWVAGIGPLEGKALVRLDDIDALATASDYVTVSGGWDMPRLVRELPSHICDVPPAVSRDDDVPVWKHSTDGVFKVASDYKQNNRDPLFLAIWKSAMIFVRNLLFEIVSFAHKVWDSGNFFLVEK